MTISDNDQTAGPQHVAAVLTALRAEFPSIRITNCYYGTGRAWLARGPDGRPWLVISDNLAKFRAMLRGY